MLAERADDIVPDRPVVLVAHGSRVPAARAVIERICADVVSAGFNAQLAYVDVQTPTVDEAVARCHTAPVVVPLLLTVGYHVRVDIARACAARAGTAVTAPLGPHRLLAEALHERLLEVALRPEDEVVLAAAGSSDADAKPECERQAMMLGELLDRPVGVAFLSAAQPSVAEILRRPRPGRLVLSSYLLAPGLFHNTLREAAESAEALVTEPIGAHPSITRMVQRLVTLGNQSG